MMWPERVPLVRVPEEAAVVLRHPSKGPGTCCFFGHSDLPGEDCDFGSEDFFCFTTRPERVPVAGEVVSSTWSSVSGTGAIGASGCCVLPSELCAVLGSEISAAMGI